MSNESGASSTASIGRAKTWVAGLPRRCWCGEMVVSRMSNSNSNPYRRYFRCAFAAERKLSNHNHVYKWLDEALVEEIEDLEFQTGKLEQEILSERMEEEKKRIDELQLKMEKDVSEAKTHMTKMMLVALLGCMIIVIVSKLV